jgi:hypothetical protein
VRYRVGAEVGVADPLTRDTGKVEPALRPEPLEVEPRIVSLG